MATVTHISAFAGPELLIALALLGPLILVHMRRRGIFGHAFTRQMAVGAVGMWLVASVTLSLSGRLDPPLTLQSAPLLPTLLWGVGGGIAGLLTFPAYLAFARKAGFDHAANADVLQKIATMPLAARVFILFTAALVEELLFRAIPIPLLMSVTGTSAIALAVPLFMFVIAHRASWSPVHLLFVAATGALLTLIFLRAGYWSASLAHFIIDAPMLLFAPVMMARTRPAGTVDDS